MMIFTERQHDMGGLAVLFLIGLYLFLAIKVFKSAKTTLAKAIVLLLALLIPTADAIYGRIKLQQMCKAEGGLKVNRVVRGVEGFLADSADAGSLKAYGFGFLEGDSSPGKFYRFSKQDGQIVIEENVIPKSKFKLKLTTLDDKGERYWRQFYSIEAIPNGEVLATETQIGFRGGWAERLIALFSDSGGGSVALCNTAGLDHKKLILVTLKP